MRLCSTELYYSPAYPLTGILILIIMSHSNSSHGSSADGVTITQKCLNLQKAENRGELGVRIAFLVLQHSPADIQQMKQNFNNKIRNIPPEYRDRLTKMITEHLLGTYQRIRLLEQQGAFKAMHEPLTDQQKKYWDMAGEQCQVIGWGRCPCHTVFKIPPCRVLYARTE